MDANNLMKYLPYLIALAFVLLGIFSQAPPGRREHTATALGNGEVLIVGGQSKPALNKYLGVLAEFRRLELIANFSIPPPNPLLKRRASKR
jgi:hypothetical protein